MLLSIIRHAQTDGDASPDKTQTFLKGRDPHHVYHLTEYGKWQATRLAHHLDSMGVDYVYYSPSPRVEETRRVIYETLEDRTQYRSDDRLQERDFGSLTGYNLAILEDAFNELRGWKEYEALLWLPDFREAVEQVRTLINKRRNLLNVSTFHISRTTPEGSIDPGEPLKDFIDRLFSFINEIIPRHIYDGHVAILTHGISGVALTNTLNRFCQGSSVPFYVKRGLYNQLELSNYELKLAGINSITVRPGKPTHRGPTYIGTAGSFNNVTHLLTLEEMISRGMVGIHELVETLERLTKHAKSDGLRKDGGVPPIVDEPPTESPYIPG